MGSGLSHRKLSREPKLPGNTEGVGVFKRTEPHAGQPEDDHESHSGARSLQTGRTAAANAEVSGMDNKPEGADEGETDSEGKGGETGLGDHHRVSPEEDVHTESRSGEKEEQDLSEEKEDTEKEALAGEEKEIDGKASADSDNIKLKEEEGIDKDNEAGRNQSTALSHGITVPVRTWPWKTDRSSIEEVVDQVWSQIDAQCQRFTLKHVASTAALSGWKVVRLFVSSTFHDFQNEREVLVKKVFPELKEWCMARRIHFIECDLRWGVPRDSTTRTVLCTCMEEIDRCHEDTQGEPFFLNMLGERYGWIPTEDDVPEDIAARYDWVGNCSITHMEILHGAFRFCNRNAAFFLREVEGMPDSIRAKFADPSDLGLAQIAKLKTKIANRFPEQSQTYTCQYDPTDTSTVKLTGFDKFGQDVLDYFKFAIDRKYPKKSNELSPEEEEDERQVLYLGLKGQLIYGREREISMLMDYATSKQEYRNGGLREVWNQRCRPDKTVDNAGDKESKEMKEQDEEEEKTDKGKDEGSRDGDSGETNGKWHAPVAVVAKSGQGKSSLMAKFIMEAKQAGLNVFFHLIGCSGDSLSLAKLLSRLCRHLVPSDDDRISKLVDMATKDVAQLAGSLLKEYMDSGKQLLIVIDDLTQLQRENTEWSDWIPSTLEGAVHMVFSLVQVERTMADIQNKVKTVQFLELGHLDQHARVEIVENYFGQYNKKLDPRQLELLTQSQGAENALWLALACEELRVFGSFDALTDVICGLPDSLEGLLSEILQRLTTEDETGLVEKCLCLLECSMKGLTEQELQCLLGDFEAHRPIPKLHWAMVRRMLKPFLRRVSGTCKVECLAFFHHIIGEVVKNKWLSDMTQYETYHLAMADYYQEWYDYSESFAAAHTAYHLSKSQDRNRLINFIRKDKRSRLLNPMHKSNYLKNCRCRTMINTHGPFHSQLFICNFCSMQRHAFGNDAWPNAECCVLCGQFVPPMFRKGANIAYRCQMHPLKGPRMPNAKTCMLCNKMIMKGQEKPAHLCQFCQLGGFPTCCNLDAHKK